MNILHLIDFLDAQHAIQDRVPAPLKGSWIAPGWTPAASRKSEKGMDEPARRHFT